MTTAEYFANAKGPVAPRPTNSTLDLTKIENAGYTPEDWREMLEKYLST